MCQQSLMPLELLEYSMYGQNEENEELQTNFKDNLFHFNLKITHDKLIMYKQMYSYTQILIQSTWSFSLLNWYLNFMLFHYLVVASSVPAIIWTKAEVLSVGPLGNLNQIIATLIE